MVKLISFYDWENKSMYTAYWFVKTILVKLHDPQGLKSVWKMLMAKDIILFSKAIGSIRDYFRRLNLAPPEVDEKKICIQPHHR